MIRKAVLTPVGMTLQDMQAGTFNDVPHPDGIVIRSRYAKPPMRRDSPDRPTVTFQLVQVIWVVVCRGRSLERTRLDDISLQCPNLVRG